MKASLGASLIGAVLLASCASLPPVHPSILPAFNCDAPQAVADLGDAPGRYYLHWVDANWVVVFRASPYGTGWFKLDEFKDAEHFTEAWLVDSHRLTVSRPSADWLTKELASLAQSHWNYDVKALESAALGLTSGLLGGIDLGGNLFDASQVQPDGSLVPFQGELKTGNLGALVVHFDGHDTGDLFLGQPQGGYKTALLGLQFSPDRRFIKSDRWIYDTKRDERVALYNDCAEASGLVVDPAWTRAAIMLNAGGRHRLAVTPFNANGDWR